MSWVSKYVFDPIRAAASRAQTSTNPVARATGDAAVKAVDDVGAKAAAAVQSVAVTAAAGTLTANSAAGIAHPAIAALEDGLRGVIDAFAIAALGELGPAGAALSPEAVALLNVLIPFAEQHSMTLVADLWAHVIGAANAPKA